MCMLCWHRKIVYHAPHKKMICSVLFSILKFYKNSDKSYLFLWKTSSSLALRDGLVATILEKIHVIASTRQCRPDTHSQARPTSSRTFLGVTNQQKKRVFLLIFQHALSRTVATYTIKNHSLDNFALSPQIFILVHINFV